MSERYRIDERGWWTNLEAPTTAPDDRAGRIAQASEVFDALFAIFRPLVAEIELCWRELGTGLCARAPEPPPPVLLAHEHFDAFVRPTKIGPLARIAVPRIDGEAIERCFAPKSPEGTVCDWKVIRTIASAARSCEPREALHLEGVDEPVEPWISGWFAGPLGPSGSERWAPAELELNAESTVTLRLIVRWSPWRDAGSPERKVIEGGIEALQLRGWRTVDG